MFTFLFLTGLKYQFSKSKVSDFSGETGENKEEKQDKGKEKMKRGGSGGK